MVDHAPMMADRLKERGKNNVYEGKRKNSKGKL